MKKAFTMMEFIVVIVLIGILSAVFIPRVNNNPVREAGMQLLAHIRYTQHLAMMDDKYNVNDPKWYLGRWQIAFSTAGSTNSYRIFSEHQGAYNGNPDADSTYNNSEVARNPENTNTFLIGVKNSNFNNNATDKLTPNLDIGTKYGINSVKVTGGNSSSARRVIFDSFGRPYKGSTNDSTASVLSGAQDKLANSPIYIKLCLDSCTGSNSMANNSEELTIKIENESGFACILKQNSNSMCI